MRKIKNAKASILISTMMILSVVLVTVLSFVFISNMGRNASTSSNESVVAYQRADTGIERSLAVIMDKVKNYATDTLSPDDWSSVGTCNSSDGIITKTDGGEKIYSIQLMKRHSMSSASLDPVDCDDASLTFPEVITVKSTGIVAGKTQRAVSADVPLP